MLAGGVGIHPQAHPARLFECRQHFRPTQGVASSSCMTALRYAAGRDAGQRDLPDHGIIPFGAAIGDRLDPGLCHFSPIALYSAQVFGSSVSPTLSAAFLLIQIELIR